MPPIEYENLLARVEKPGRYVGGEMNTVVKDPSELRATIALAFPDVYDVGMSYHGFRLLYEKVNARSDFAAERVFTPWPDFAKALREARLPLATLENGRPLGEVEILGFTLQHELCYTNVLEMLNLSGIPLRSERREEGCPLVIGGGAGAFSPEPVADFFDAFFVGDGEQAVLDLLERVASGREKGLERRALVESLAAVPGVYVPSLYEVAWDPDGAVRSVTPKEGSGAPAEVAPQRYDISRDLGSTRPIVPLIRTVQDRIVVEVRRGCVNGCRFCQAGMLTRPIRERPVEQVREIVRQNLENTGDDSVSLLSLSTADYSEIGPLLRSLNAEFAPRKVSISLPSLRISSFDVRLAAEVSSVRKSGFTFAPEAGSERLRKIINKPLDEADFLDIIADVLNAGWKTLKLYFMIGLPEENDEDLDGIVRIVEETRARARKEGVRGLRLNVSIAPFVPKAHTPFQWNGQIPREEIMRRLNYIRDRIRAKGVAIKTSPIESSVLEAVMARGDRRLSDVIERAWSQGCRFDAWREHFLPQAWWDAFEVCGLDPAWYAERERAVDEVFPYDHILSGVGKAYLARQRDLGDEGQTTPDCDSNPCSKCAACEKPKEHILAGAGKDSGDEESLDEGEEAKPKDESPVQASRQTKNQAPVPETSPPVMRVRLTFSKTGSLRFISHLDLAELIHRLMRRSGAVLAHSQGFNPQPRIMLSPPLPLGFEGQGELADVLLRKPVDLQQWLRTLRALDPPPGLEWTAIEEVPLKANSIQQTIEQFDYRVQWRAEGPEAAILPLERDRLEDSVALFLAAETWPIEIVRKNKVQKRDARAFVKVCKWSEPDEGFEAGLTLTIISDNGKTLSPLKILAAIFHSDIESGVLLQVVRKAIQI